MSTLDLAEKLLATLHLNVPERGRLPEGKMPFSALVQAAQEVLKQNGFMPPMLRPTSDFTGVLLEVRGERLFIHERHEIGVMRYSPTVTKPATNLPNAVRQFIDANGGDNIDGIEISFDT